MPKFSKIAVNKASEANHQILLWWCCKVMNAESTGKFSVLLVVFCEGL